MCGIVGLHLLNTELRPRLGELLTAMLDAMATRGPDSAGLAVYSDETAGPWPAEPGMRYSLRAAAATRSGGTCWPSGSPRRPAARSPPGGWPATRRC